MNCQTRSYFGQQKIPATQMFSLLDDQLIIFVRAWGSQEYNQKFVDEIAHFLSTAQADIEMTSPFDFVENLTALTNKVRIAFLMAHDYFYKTENKNSYSVGFEAAVIMQSKKEVAWGTVGRFNIYQVHNEKVSVLSAVGTDRDKDVLLPIELIGIEKDIDIRLGSLELKNKKLIIASTFQGDLQFNVSSTNNQDDDWGIQAEADEQSTYWLSKIKLD